MKKMLFVGAALAAMVASQAHAASLVISTGVVEATQTAAASTQNAVATAAAQGDIRNNSEFSNVALNGKNMATIDQAVQSGGAQGAETSASVSGFLAGFDYESGDEASSTASSAASSAANSAASAASGSSSTDNLLGPDSESDYASAANASASAASSSAYQAASNSSWENASGFLGGFDAEFSTEGFSADMNFAAVDIAQYADVTTQSASAQLTTGNVLDYSMASNAAINLTNSLNLTQAAGNCLTCVPDVVVTP